MFGWLKLNALIQDQFLLTDTLQIILVFIKIF